MDIEINGTTYEVTEVKPRQSRRTRGAAIAAIASVKTRSKYICDRFKRKNGEPIRFKSIERFRNYVVQSRCNG